MSLYPLLLEASLHVKVWGGRKLQTHFGKALATAEPYGEAWEVHDSAKVINGHHAGQTLGALLQDYGADLIGTAYDPSEGLPLLVKLIDAADWLSVQVHPNDEQAQALEGQARGKSEAWVILASEADSKLVIGVKAGVTREAMAAAIQNGTLDQHLVYADVQAGDVLYIPAGTIHAIGTGILVYEIQQSSDTTYRLYDWNRLGLDGKAREMHIEKGVQVSRVESLPTLSHARQQQSPEILVESPFFVTKWLTPPYQEVANQHFAMLTCIAGQVTVIGAEMSITVNLGQSLFIPACLTDYQIAGTGEILMSQPNHA